MLKLNASYSKKVPAESEYSSQSYHAQIEVELPDGLTQEQLQGRIHETFEMVRSSVEAELHGKTPSVTRQAPAADIPQNTRHGYPPRARNSNVNSNNDVSASPKQIKYLLDLARNVGWTPQQIASKYNVQSVEELTKRQCSDLINEWKEVA